MKKKRKKQKKRNPLVYKYNLQKQDDSNLHRLAMTASMYGNRCHTMLRCQYKMFRRYFRQVDESTMWHCMVQQLYRKPIIIIVVVVVIIVAIL